MATQDLRVVEQGEDVSQEPSCRAMLQMSLCFCSEPATKKLLMPGKWRQARSSALSRCLGKAKLVFLIDIVQKACKLTIDFASFTWQQAREA